MMTIMISNIAGGNAKIYRLLRGGGIPDAAIRHARSLRSTFGGWQCSDPNAAERIEQYLEARWPVEDKQRS